jgi:hypothetical protein
MVGDAISHRLLHISSEMIPFFHLQLGRSLTFFSEYPNQIATCRGDSSGTGDKKRILGLPSDRDVKSDGRPIFDMLSLKVPRDAREHR